MPTLSIIATPIGNLEDITLRALRVLKEADLVLCEDTRTTAKLLQKYEIKVPTMSYHAHSKLAKVDKIFALLEEGKNLALVSDAGTPCISDPGVLLVAQVRARFGDAVSISPIPGPSAVISALSASGLPASDFLFLGFLPHKKGRETLFKEIAASTRTVAFYESPHRIEKALASLSLHTGEDRRTVVARELTKIHEEFFSGTAAEAQAFFTKNPGKVRGEFVVIVAPQA
ncbi:MAG: 16S rRNA (cytidine(1402)-2'-O)-methyltransferase [Candidatus Yonathbacteria bacterium RIFOXYD1_FULL_52_36]|uniref:Ribosomal RNA small subunit methyltransferase I n=1 Tax=Candidatus Yonathbacteria bacterium RIFOXYD1_FULL_52_36 TaxID=1802730 RepID=A0A1G2SKF3_9BACT|nr:MAG: 16S rRNA (cytidine(1402)-2'-O)-methyltransferase [Candidatus Yonathbacteria bacterium RIFOXYD1_FULL_52_36]